MLGQSQAADQPFIETASRHIGSATLLEFVEGRLAGPGYDHRPDQPDDAAHQQAERDATSDFDAGDMLLQRPNDRPDQADREDEHPEPGEPGDRRWFAPQRAAVEENAAFFGG